MPSFLGYLVDQGQRRSAGVSGYYERTHESPGGMRVRIEGFATSNTRDEGRHPEHPRPFPKGHYFDVNGLYICFSRASQNVHVPIQLKSIVGNDERGEVTFGFISHDVASHSLRFLPIWEMGEAAVHMLAELRDLAADYGVNLSSDRKRPCRRDDCKSERDVLRGVRSAIDRMIAESLAVPEKARKRRNPGGTKGRG